uniref:Uncharacterized protein n=1 Tax=Piliocolobus tephrosceles TaxID=591936 RepID=A0A8C9HLA0_9PRIM
MRWCHLPLDMCPQIHTRSALGQTDRQVLLQEAQVAFHVPRMGSQLLPELFHLLHQSLVEVLPVGLHPESELLHMPVQVPAQLCQRLLQPLGVAPQVATHVLGQGRQPLPQFLRTGRDPGLELLGVLLHLEGQALELVVELLLCVLSIGSQAAAQLLHGLVDLDFELVGVGREALLELFHVLVDLGLELVGVGPQRGLQAVGVLPQHSLHALCVGGQLAPQLLSLRVDLGAQLVRVGLQALLQLSHVFPDLLAHLIGMGQQPGPHLLQLLPNLLLQFLRVLGQAFMQLGGEGHQLLLQVTCVSVHFSKFVLEEGTVGKDTRRPRYTWHSRGKTLSACIPLTSCTLARTGECSGLPSSPSLWRFTWERMGVTD